MIPLIAVVAIDTPCWRMPRIWFPLFLLWILVLLLSPILLLVLLAACIAARVSFWRVLAVFWGLLCSLPGTDVRVSSDGNHVVVRIL